MDEYINEGSEVCRFITQGHSVRTRFRSLPTPRVGFFELCAQCSQQLWILLWRIFPGLTDTGPISFRLSSFITIQNRPILYCSYVAEGTRAFKPHGGTNHSVGHLVGILGRLECHLSIPHSFYEAPACLLSLEEEF